VDGILTETAIYENPFDIGIGSTSCVDSIVVPSNPSSGDDRLLRGMKLWRDHPVCESNHRPEQIRD
jgi:hypothetical protein